MTKAPMRAPVAKTSGTMSGERLKNKGVSRETFQKSQIHGSFWCQIFSIANSKV